MENKKKTYAKPKISSETMFEKTVLTACNKLQASSGCQPNKKDS